MKKIHNYLLTLILGALLLGGCQEELTEPDTSAVEPAVKTDARLVPVSKLTAQDQQMVTFAKSLAKSLEDQAMREYVKAEALKMFDGEHNLLYEFVRQQSVGDQLFSARLADSYVSNNPNSRVNARALFEQEMQDIPLLNIGVPIHTESWDIENFVPWVGVLTSDYNEQTSEKIRAYDSDGRLHLIDAKIEPDFPVVFVRLNERLIPINKIKDGLRYRSKYSIAENVGAHISAKIEEDDPLPPPPPPPPSGGSSCDRSGSEYMVSLKFASMADLTNAEGYANDGPEFQLYIWSFDKAVKDGRDNATWHDFKAFAATRNQVVYTTNLGLTRKPQWWTRNLKLFDWDADMAKGYVGDELEYYWVESDAGDVIDAIDLALKGVLNVTIPGIGSVGREGSITVKQKFARGDVKLGTSRINLCDREPESYDTGSLIFNVDAK